VLNRDDSSYEYLSQHISGPQISYGLEATADIRAQAVEYSPQGLHFKAVGDGFVSGHKPLVGTFNVSNCLAALAAASRGLGLDAEAIADGIAAMPGIPGRMERVDLGQPFTAIVDFAHTQTHCG